MKQVNLVELSSYLSEIYKEIGYYYSNEASDWIDDIRNMENNAEEINEDINIDGDGEILKEYNIPLYKGDKSIRPCVYFKDTFLKDGTVDTCYYLTNYDYYKYIKNNYKKESEVLKKMNDKTFIINNFSKKEFLELSKNYEYIVICKDNFLSSWGDALNKNHYLMILCKTCKDMQHTRSVLETRKARSNEFSYINWYPLAKITNRYIDNIMRYKYKYSVSLRNDKFIA